MHFKDHFSDASAQYAEFRPTYPDALFAWLASLCTERKAAWDCATGSGQAATGLAQHFEQVFASDASSEQITHASGPQNIKFTVASAECSGLADNSVDLITVAQAAHWFDLPAFYAEARRALKPGGIIALWGYGRLALPDSMDAPFANFYHNTVGPYWPAERRLIDDGYQSLNFPFAEITAPEFFIEVDWTLPKLLAYLSTWSAVKRYISAKSVNPQPALEALLMPLWGSPETPKRLKWPLFLRIGRVRSSAL